MASSNDPAGEGTPTGDGLLGELMDEIFGGGGGESSGSA
jgi:hypothetical protein